MSYSLRYTNISPIKKSRTLIKVHGGKINFGPFPAFIFLLIFNIEPKKKAHSGLKIIVLSILFCAFFLPFWAVRVAPSSAVGTLGLFQEPALQPTYKIFFLVAFDCFIFFFDLKVNVWAEFRCQTCQDPWGSKSNPHPTDQIKTLAAHWSHAVAPLDWLAFCRYFSQNLLRLPRQYFFAIFSLVIV